MFDNSTHLFSFIILWRFCHCIKETIPRIEKRRPARCRAFRSAVHVFVVCSMSPSPQACTPTAPPQVPKRFHALGVKPAKGTLLYSPPDTRQDAAHTRHRIRVRCKVPRRQRTGQRSTWLARARRTWVRYSRLHGHQAIAPNLEKTHGEVDHHIVSHLITHSWTAFDNARRSGSSAPPTAPTTWTPCSAALAACGHGDRHRRARRGRLPCDPPHRHQEDAHLQ